MPVLFPFGYGLSYTNFAYSELKLSAETIQDTDSLTVTVKVKNTGARFGKEIVQLYIHDNQTQVIRPLKELKGFEKVALYPGEEKTVSFALNNRAFAYYNTQNHENKIHSKDRNACSCASNNARVFCAFSNSVKGKFFT